MTTVLSLQDVTPETDHIQKNALEFRTLYNQVFPIIFHVTRSICHDAEAAEDICQETFIRFIEKTPVIPNKDEIKYWLIRVAKNIALNYVKHKKVERNVTTRLRYEEKITIKTGEILLLQEETRRELKMILEELPSSYFKVIILKEYGEFNYREIGRILGISEGAVKIRVFRARQRLLTIFKKHPYSDFFTDNNCG
ncbi:MAG: RNA polymerase sigma factor [Treponema sp.]|jgi:RNA polymerase sigma-70 factor (ECF subfamily)|nr:RNA polymerase sigma factor [Treponema sp.]